MIDLSTSADSCIGADLYIYYKHCTVSRQKKFLKINSNQINIGAARPVVAVKNGKGCSTSQLSEGFGGSS